jgi:hypothetical protein
VNELQPSWRLPDADASPCSAIPRDGLSP